MAELPLEEGPCPSCTALPDNWDRAVPMFRGREQDRGRGKSPDRAGAGFRAHDGWRHKAALSRNNSFKSDYHGEYADGEQAPILTVFQKPRTGRPD